MRRLSFRVSAPRTSSNLSVSETFRNIGLAVAQVCAVDAGVAGIDTMTQPVAERGPVILG